MEDFTIRPAVKDDEAALGRLGGALMRQHYAFDPLRFLHVESPEIGYGRFLVSEIEDPESVVLVAERAGEVVGYAYAGLEPMSWKELRAACGFLHDVYVDESARHTGVGRRLVRSAVEWLESRGTPRVVLWSAAANEPAVGWFRNLGFRPTMIEMTIESSARTTT